MQRRHFLQQASFALISQTTSESEGERRARWLEMAESLKPKLNEAVRTPVAIVRPVADSALFLRWRMQTESPAGSLREHLMRAGDAAILDFGEHLTGYLTFSIAGEGRGVDAPARVKLTFGEVPAEVAEPLDPYKGTLSRAWLQDEVINIDVLPATIRLPRRYAFRHVKVEVIATSPNFAVRFDSVTATAVTSAAREPGPLPAGVPELMRKIDAVSVRTLRDCMQTVFEDGPKRDRRLWIGDLRLQALTNYATFRNYDLVKRCLYLFAALPREDGLVAACVFEEPRATRGHEYIMDYAALYGACVLDYARAANDWKTALDLWPVVQRQMQILGKFVAPNGLFRDPGGWWIFVDWNRALEKTASMHGILLYGFRCALELARKAGAAAEVAEYTQIISMMTAAARSSFFDASRGLFESGAQRQVSWATQAWMVLSGVATKTEGAAALRAVRGMREAVRPGGPYLYHYFADAMLDADMKQEALELIGSYWGGMIRDGADTFWEVYGPADPTLSPYGSVVVNSYCHAWSCTPSYLLRTRCYS